MKKGKFIVFEGTDGGGKATQLKLLVKYLKGGGYKVAQTDFPHYTSFFGKLVGRFLKGEFGGVNQVSPYLACLPYAGDRFQASKEIKKWLSEGKIVVSNRYIGSNMGHQTIKLPERQQTKFLKFLEEMEYRVFGIPQEDIVIFLYVPPAVGQRLVDEKGKRGYLGGQKRDIHEASLDHQKKASQMYFRLVRRYPYWVKVDCCDEKGNLKPPEGIHREVLKILKRRKILP